MTVNGKQLLGVTVFSIPNFGNRYVACTGKHTDFRINSKWLFNIFRVTLVSLCHRLLSAEQGLQELCWVTGERACYSTAQRVWRHIVVTVPNRITERLHGTNQSSGREAFSFHCRAIFKHCQTCLQRERAREGERGRESLLMIMETPSFCSDDSEGLSLLGYFSHVVLLSLYPVCDFSMCNINLFHSH